MEDVKNQILETLKKRKCDLNYKELFTLVGLGKGKKKEFLQQALNELELAGTIIKNKDDTYNLSPPNYYICELFPSTGKSKFVVIDDQKYIINEKDLNGALDFDTVGIKLYNDGTIKINRPIKRNTGHIVCEMVLNKEGILIPKKIDGNLPVKIISKDEKKLVDGNFVLLKIGKDSINGYYEATIEEIIGHRNDPNIGITAIAVNKGIPTKFSNEYLRELNKIPTDISNEDISDRTDLRNHNFFTIDCVKTKDMDDAVEIELLENGNLQLMVSIADVSHYFSFDSIFYKEAYERGTSYYLNDSVFPMFHPIISNGICSLNPNVDRLTKTVIMEIDKNGEVVNYDIVKSVINSRKKMSYDDVNEILENKKLVDGYQPHLKDLLLMEELSNILEKKKITKGYIDFGSHDIEVNYDKEENPINFIKRERRTAERIIENFMIWTNETVANHIFWLNLPFAYRVHGMPNKYKLEGIVNLIDSLGYNLNFNTKKFTGSPREIQNIVELLHNKEEFPILASLLLCAMQRAVYSPINTGHFALGSECYTHFTSPIRRLIDLTIHILMDKYFFSNKPISNEDLKEIELKLQDICKQANITELLEESAEQAAKELSMIEYADSKNIIGKKYVGYITSITRNYIKIVTEDNIIGYIDSQELLGNNFKFSANNRFIYDKNNQISYKLGNKILITACWIDKINNKIYFSLEDNLSKKHKPTGKRLVKKI